MSYQHFRVNTHSVVAWLSENSLFKTGTITEVWLNVWVVIYELSGCIFSNFVAYMDDIYENIEKCNQDKEHKILIKFDNMIVDQLSKKD